MKAARVRDLQEEPMDCNKQVAAGRDTQGCMGVCGGGLVWSSEASTLCSKNAAELFDLWSHSSKRASRRPALPDWSPGVKC